MTFLTINAERRLFVLPSGSGYSCLGFDVVFKRLRQFHQMLGLPAPQAADIGTMSQYRDYRMAESAYIATKPQATLFDPDTPAAVQTLLESYRALGGRVRLFFGDPETGRDHLEEHDVVGRVSRSMGPIRVPLLISKANSFGGMALLTAHIVRIVDAETKRERYRHPLYRTPEFTVQPASATAAASGYPTAVLSGGVVRGNFKSEDHAQKWIAFMTGSRMTPH